MKLTLAAALVIYVYSPSTAFVAPNAAFRPKVAKTSRLPSSSALFASVQRPEGVQRPDVTKKDKRREYMAKDTYFK